MLKICLVETKVQTMNLVHRIRLWRATFDVIDFMPLVTVDYSGGMIITDWYTDSNTTNDSLKFTIRFLSNQIRADSLKIIIHKKTCKGKQIV